MGEFLIESPQAGGRLKSRLPILVTVCFYVFAILWLLNKKDLLHGVVWLEWKALAALLFISAILNCVLYPFRYMILLSGAEVRLSFKEAVRDRLFYSALKRLGPFLVTDTIGFYMITMRWRMPTADVLLLWSIDKTLSLVAMTGFLVAGIFGTVMNNPLLGLFIGFAFCLTWLILGWLIHPATRLSGVSHLKVLGLLQKMDGAMRAFSYPLSSRILLNLLSIGAEGLEILGLGFAFGKVLTLDWTGLTLFKIVGVYLSASLPFTLLGAGSREVTALVLFAGDGPDFSIFIAAFTVFLIVNLLPAAVGMFFFKKYLVKGRDNPGR